MYVYYEYHIFQKSSVELSFSLDEEVNKSCGGSVVNSKWIVTSLHCVVESLNVQDVNDLVISSPANTYVRVGDHDLKDRDETDITK